MTRIIKQFFLTGLMVSLLFSCGNEAEKAAESTTKTEETAEKEWRIVSLNGTITELLYELNLQDKIVGVDITSTYPESAKSITNLGHTSQLNAEAILALKPNLILMDEKAAGSKALEGLKNAGIELEVIDVPTTLDGSLHVAKKLGEVLNQPINTEALAEKIGKNTHKLTQLLEAVEEKPKVLFIYARGAQAMMVAGKNTFAEKMIELAGGTHVVQEFESFKPLTPEALLAYQPDAILMFSSGLESLADAENGKSGKDQLLGMPGVEQTPAGKNQKIITMEGLYLSGFGPRASAAALELATQLHTEKASLLSEVE